MISLYGFMNMLPVSSLSWLSNRYVHEFTSEGYLMIRACSLEPNNSNGLTNRKTMFLNAVRSAASFDNIKDWTASEQTALSAYLNDLFDFCMNFRSHQLIRQLAAHMCAKIGDDTKCIWTDTTWETFCMVMSRLPLPFVRQIADLVDLLNPVIQVADQIPERNIPPSFALMWVPMKSSSAMVTMRATLLANVEGANWMAKIQLPMVRDTITNVFSRPTRIIRPSATNEFAFWYAESPVVMSYDGGARSWENLNGMGDASLTATAYWFLPGTEPHPLWSFKEFMTIYNATYAPLGCLIQGATTNNFPGVTYSLAAAGKTQLDVILVSFANTSSTLNLADDNETAVEDDMIHLCGLWSGAAISAMGGSAYLEDYPLFSMFRYQTAGSTAWSYAAQNLVTSMWQALRGPVLKKQASRRPPMDRGKGRPVVTPEQKPSSEYGKNIEVVDNGTGRGRSKPMGNNRNREKRRKR